MRKKKSQYLKEGQNGCTRSGIRIEQKSLFHSHSPWDRNSTNLVANATKILAIPHKNNMIGDFDFKRL